MKRMADIMAARKGQILADSPLPSSFSIMTIVLSFKRLLGKPPRGGNREALAAHHLDLRIGLASQSIFSTGNENYQFTLAYPTVPRTDGKAMSLCSASYLAS